MKSNGDETDDQSRSDTGNDPESELSNYDPAHSSEAESDTEDTPTADGAVHLRCVIISFSKCIATLDFAECKGLIPSHDDMRDSITQNAIGFSPRGQSQVVLQDISYYTSDQRTPTHLPPRLCTRPCCPTELGFPRRVR